MIFTVASAVWSSAVAESQPLTMSPPPDEDDELDAIPLLEEVDPPSPLDELDEALPLPPPPPEVPGRSLLQPLIKLSVPKQRNPKIAAYRMFLL